MPTYAGNSLLTVDIFRFKDLEKAIKAFLQNSDLFGNRYRDLLNLERLLLEHISDVWASDHTDMVESYGTAMRRIADHLYRQFVSILTRFYARYSTRPLLEQIKLSFSNV